jgi:hypothetical protein
MNTKFKIDSSLPSDEDSLSDLIHNKFRSFDPIFKSSNDIFDFIKERKLNVPVLTNLLELKFSNRLEMTPTEIEFYFDSMFDYVYDVFRVPHEYTYKETEKWLDYINSKLFLDGINGIIKEEQESAVTKYKTRLEINKLLFTLDVYRYPKEINYHLNVCDSPYYIREDTNIIESYWIKSSMDAGQPEVINNEAYMRVHVYPDRVYIYGCDDCSYTLDSDNIEELKEFSKLLKCAAPVWNFNYIKSIHPKLEFTN